MKQSDLKPAQECPDLAEIRDEAKMWARALRTLLQM